MRTPSVNPAAGPDEGRVIMFPRRQTIGITAPHAAPSRSHGPDARDFGAMTGYGRFKAGPPVGDERAQSGELEDFEIQNDLVQQLKVANLPAHVARMMQTGTDQPVAGSQMFPQRSPIMEAGRTSKAAPAPRAEQTRPGCSGSGYPASAPAPEMRKAAAARLVAVSDNSRPSSGSGSALSGRIPETASANLHSNPLQDSLLQCMAAAHENSAGAAGPSAQASDISQYIAHMTQELAQMARASRLDLLAYFLEMAELEARMRTSAAPIKP